MTKKDYILIAGAINEQRASHDRFTGNVKAAKDRALLELSYVLAGRLGEQNPLFDRDRFMMACGFPNSFTA